MSEKKNVKYHCYIFLHEYRRIFYNKLQYLQNIV